MSYSRDHHSENHHRTWRRTAALTVAVGVAVLAAACGTSPSSSSDGAAGSSQPGGSTAYQQSLPFAECMRSHGVPNFPDPASNGGFDLPPGINPQSTQVQAAEQACKHLLPNGGQVNSSQQQQDASQMLNFAKCMRSHGVLNYPDPSSNGLQVNGIDTKSPQYQRALSACRADLPGGGSGGPGGGPGGGNS